MKDCVFCKMVKGEIPVNIVYEDDIAFAFLDNYPIDKAHTLIIPKQHYSNIFEIPQDTLKHIYGVTQDLAKAISKAFDVKDMNILQNNGVDAGQTVFHYHVHIIPKYENFRFYVGNGESTLDEKVRKEKQIHCSEEISELIRKEL